MDQSLLHYRWPKVKRTPNRLVNINSLQLAEFPNDAPPYAILSHRWAEEEVSFDAFNTADEDKAGFTKIAGLCAYIRALNHGSPDGTQDYTGPLVEWVWVDTCCIDKRSSAELSEAINSMAAWYQYACFCVAYLQDVSLADVAGPTEEWHAFRSSEWFRRGWTLQELVFPPTVIFCTREWHEFLWMGPNRKHAIVLVSSISGIPEGCLRNSRAIFRESIARRISWAANRSTARKEDEAYCLLGLLDINMPLIYGEGERAFVRLQEEIIRRNDDESIFAWFQEPSTVLDGQLVPKDSQTVSRIFPGLVQGPAQFKDSSDIFLRPLTNGQTYSITNRGLEVRARSVCFRWTAENASVYEREIFVIQLNCCYYSDNAVEPVLIALVQKEHGEHYRRVYPYRDVWKHLMSLMVRSEEPPKVTSEPMLTFHIAILPFTGQAINPLAKTDMTENIWTLQDRWLSMVDTGRPDDRQAVAINRYAQSPQSETPSAILNTAEADSRSDEID